MCTCAYMTADGSGRDQTGNGAFLATTQSWWLYSHRFPVRSRLPFQSILIQVWLRMEMGLSFCSISVVFCCAYSKGGARVKGLLTCCSIAAAVGRLKGDAFVFPTPNTQLLYNAHTSLGSCAYGCLLGSCIRCPDR